MSLGSSRSNIIGLVFSCSFLYLKTSISDSAVRRPSETLKWRNIFNISLLGNQTLVPSGLGVKSLAQSLRTPAAEALVTKKVANGNNTDMRRRRGALDVVCLICYKTRAKLKPI